MERPPINTFGRSLPSYPGRNICHTFLSLWGAQCLLSAYFRAEKFVHCGVTSYSSGSCLAVRFKSGVSPYMLSCANCREVWESAPNGSSLCALINGDIGWLMFLPSSEDPGFSSRNPSYSGPLDEMIEYRLSNGQVDLYPASWALPLATIERAFASFRDTGKPPTFVRWHNDSGDALEV